MKSIITYYSRTGNTEKIAKAISTKLETETEKITESKNRKGIIGYLSAGKDSMSKKETPINEISRDFNEFDLVIIGTPIWAFTVAAPVRTFCSKYKFKKVAFFATQGGKGADKAFEEMAKLTKDPVATLIVTETDIKTDSYNEKVEEFVKKIS